MTTIVLRANTPGGLTNTQLDANFTNLNNDKVETSYLSNTFAGTTNITTLGTIATGTWSASTIAVNKGGTGVTTSTGTGSVVLSTSPTLVTPTLGVASATSINKVAITAPATGSTLTIADGKTLTASNTLTFTGTDASSVAFGAGGTVVYTANKLSALSATTSAELAGVISDETGTGKLTFATSPTFTTSILTDSTTFAIANTTATTLNIGGAATTIAIGASTGTTTIGNSLVVTGNLTVNGTTTSINTATISVDDIAIELGDVTTPTDTTANGGGIILKGTTNKTILWNSTDVAWNSSESFNVATGKQYEIGGTSVLSSTTLGSGVTFSSLTSVGVIATGTWQATDIGLAHGGTGATLTAADGGIVYSTSSALAIADIAGVVYANTTGAPTAATAANIGSIVDTRYAMIGTTTPTSEYLYVTRTSTSPTLYVRQGSTGDLASFFVSATAGATSGTSYVTLTNTGGINATGVLATANGTAALPSHTFISDTNTGISSNGADILTISTAGAARVTVNAIGDVNVNKQLGVGGTHNPATGPITTLGAITAGGTGYMNGTHTSVPLTSAGGANALGTVTVAGGIVTGVTLTWGGYRYSAAEVLTVGTPATTVATTAASGTGSAATITFAAQAAAPFQVGAQIVVAGVTPTAYNGTFTVTACTTTTVTYASTATGAQTVAGTVKQGTALTNATLTASAVQGTGVYIASSSVPRIRLENTATSVSSGTELGTILFSSADGSANASGDVAYIRAIAAGTSGGGYFQFFTSVNGGAPSMSMYLNSTEQYNTGHIYLTTSDDVNADATTTFIDSSALYLRSKYWSGTASTVVDWNMIVDATAASATGNQLLVRVGTTTKLTLTNAGALTAVDNITAYSDIRYKTDILRIENPVEKVKALGGYTYTRTDTGSRQTGVIAQEVQAVLPEAVMVADNEEKTLSVAYGNLAGLLIEAIKEQQKQIDELKSQLAALK